MLAFLTENMGTIIVGAVLLAVVVLIVAGMIRSKRKGESSCGGGCGSCPMSSACGDHKK